MKKKVLFLFVAGLALLLFPGSNRPPGAADTGVVITDDAGRQVVLDSVPTRIVSLSPANTEIIYAIGGGDRVVGVTDFCNYPAKAMDKPSVGGYSDINLELVVSLSPDLVLADSLHMPEIVPALEGLGITTAVIIPETIAGVLDALLLTGKLTGLEEEARAIMTAALEKKEQIAESVKGLPRPGVFWELSADLWTSGPGSFIDDLIITAGGYNIAAGAGSPWVQLSTEVLIEKNPDFIFLADHPFGENRDTVSSRPGLENLAAVVNQQIIEIDDVDLVSRPGPRVMEALEYIAGILHPEAIR